MTVSPRAPHWIGSLLSAFVGWLTFSLLVVLYELSVSPEEGLYGSLYIVATGIVTSIVWLVVLLPSYVSLPARSPLWRWPVCTACGVAAGTLVGGVVFSFLDPDFIIRAPLGLVGVNLFLGGIIGGAACLFGSLTAPFFRTRDPFRFSSRPSATLRHATRLRAVARRLKDRFIELAGQ